MIFNRIIILALICYIVAPTPAESKTIPGNYFELKDKTTKDINISLNDYLEILSKFTLRYEGIFNAHNSEFDMPNMWSSRRINAIATAHIRQGEFRSFVKIHGGLARHHKVTKDGLYLIACHEIGHHLAGYPFNQRGASTEGQADYFAAHSCFKDFFKHDHQNNAEAINAISATEKRHCLDSWEDQNDRTLCFRTMSAIRSVVAFQGHMAGQSDSYATPSQSIVSQTNLGYPSVQCRLDTYVAAAKCSKEFSEDTIPGFGSDFMVRPSNSFQSQSESDEFTCNRTSDVSSIGARPRCWFKELSF